MSTHRSSRALAAADAILAGSFAVGLATIAIAILALPWGGFDVWAILMDPRGGP